MAKVQIDNPNEINARELLPETIMEAEVDDCEFPFSAPWDSENIGVNFVFTITDDQYPQHKGRKMFSFVTVTKGKPFAGRYKEFCEGLGLDPASWDTEDVVGMKCAIEIGGYQGKDGTPRNSVDKIFGR